MQVLDAGVPAEPAAVREAEGRVQQDVQKNLPEVSKETGWACEAQPVAQPVFQKSPKVFKILKKSPKVSKDCKSLQKSSKLEIPKSLRKLPKNWLGL